MLKCITSRLYTPGGKSFALLTKSNLWSAGDKPRRLGRDGHDQVHRYSHRLTHLPHIVHDDAEVVPAGVIAALCGRV